MANKRFLVALLIVLGAGLSLGAWGLFLRPVRVEVIEAQQDVAVQVFGLGTVEARVASKIGFKVSGVLSELKADHGDRVAKGAVLARLDTREQAARVGRAMAAIDQAEASLKRAAAGVDRAEASHANARSINERRQALAKRENVSAEAAEAARAAMDIAQAEIGLARSDVDVARAAGRDARAQLELEQVTLDLHTLAAPYDALVVARQKELGSVVAPGEPVFALIDPGTVWVLAYVDESKAGNIHVGQPAEIVLRSHPGERVGGRVARVQIESDRANEERRIEVAFDRIPENFHLGEQAEVYITTTRLAQAWLVPEPAVEGHKGGRGSVWTVEDGQLAQREVTLGHRMLDGRIEIIAGVPAGASVVARPVAGLRIGRAAVARDKRG